MSKNRKTIIHVSESFTVRKINPLEIASRYFKGEFDKRGLPNFKIQTSNALVKMGKNIGKNSDSEVYHFVDRANNNQTIYTTNHNLYQYVKNLQNGNNLEVPILRCKYCKRGNLKKPIGLPISMSKSDQEVIFNVIDSFCDFGCAFSYLKRRNSESRLYRGPLYMNAEQLLYCLYYRVYPERVGKSIKEKPDWDLLRENGGPLNDDEFDSDSAIYIDTFLIITLPAKRQYMKIHTKNAREV